MKVIFLDIDGVLNVYSRDHDEFGSQFHDHLVENLKYIIDNTNAKIVISSSWRSGGLERMKDMWTKRNYPAEVIGVTPDLSYQDDNDEYHRVKRGEEIDWYLKKNTNIENYVILDDDTDFLPHQLGNFVQCSTNINHPDCVDIGYGLTKICSERAIRILNRN